MKKVLLLSAFILASCGHKQTKQEIHKKQIKSLFMYHNGPHRQAYEAIKSDLKDPNSFENLGSKYVEDTIKNTLIVRMDFTASNSFGANIKDYVLFESDTLGNIKTVFKWID